MDKMCGYNTIVSVSEQADDFYHAANNLLLSLVAYTHRVFGQTRPERPL